MTEAALTESLQDLVDMYDELLAENMREISGSRAAIAKASERGLPGDESRGAYPAVKAKPHVRGRAARRVDMGLRRVLRWFRRR